MTFLALDAQKNLFTLQKSQLQFEQTLVMSRANYITKQMGYRAQELQDQEIDTDDDPTYIQLQQEESYLETRQDSLDSQDLLDSRNSRERFKRLPRNLREARSAALASEFIAEYVPKNIIDFYCSEA